MMSTQTKHLPDFIRLAFDSKYHVKELPTMDSFLGILRPSPAPLPTPELQQPEPLSKPEPQAWVDRQMDRVLTHLDAWEQKRFTIEMLSQTEEVLRDADEMLRFSRQQARALGVKIDTSGLRTSMDILTQYARAFHTPLAEVPPGHAVH